MIQILVLVSYSALSPNEDLFSLNWLTTLQAMFLESHSTSFLSWGMPPRKKATNNHSAPEEGLTKTHFLRRMQEAASASAEWGQEEASKAGELPCSGNPRNVEEPLPDQWVGIHHQDFLYSVLVNLYSGEKTHPGQQYWPVIK